MALLDGNRPSYSNDNHTMWWIVTYPIAFPLWFIWMLFQSNNEGDGPPLSASESKERLRRHNKQQRASLDQHYAWREKKEREAAADRRRARRR